MPEVDGPEALAEFCALDPTLVSPALLSARDQAFRRYGDIAHLRLGSSRASVSIHPSVRDDQDAPVGLIGHLVLSDERATADLLDEAHTWLHARGARVVRGPAVRHTWYPFRAVVEGADAWPRLSGEPWNAADLPDRLQAHGYRVWARYLTTRTDRAMQVERSAHKLERLEHAGFSIRPLDPSTLLQDLGQVLALVNRSFAPPQNTMFVPIDLPEFALVLGMIPGGTSVPAGFDPEWIRLCFAADGTLAGFVYVTRDGDLASVKTLCVAPEYRGDGVGGALVAGAHRLARHAGVTWVAHSLMADAGPSMSITSAGGHEVLRRYVLFEKHL